MRRFVGPKLHSNTSVRHFFPGFFETAFATGVAVGKVGFGMFCLVAASDLKAAYRKNDDELHAADMLRTQGLMPVVRHDCPETAAIPYSLRARQQTFARAAEAAVAQVDPNVKDQYGFLPLQYVIANGDFDGLFTLARKGVVITPEAVDMAKTSGCSENFIAALTTLTNLQKEANDRPSITMK